jgi:hypothetical protein
VIHWLLTRLEKNPHALFEEWELRRQDPVALEDLRREGLIRRLSASQAGHSYVDPSGRLLTVVSNPDGTLEAIDEDDPECQPVPVALSEVASWRVNLEALCGRFREANSLSGPFGELNERLYLLGGLSPGRVAVLAFLSDEASGVPLLQALLALAPAASREFLVFLPSLTLPPPEQRRLESLRIWVQTLRSDDPFALRRLAATTPVPEAAGQANAGFEHSDDYRWVKLRGREFTLTPLQAEIVRILDEARVREAPDVGWKTICTQLHEGYPRHMSDSFRNVAGWQDLIASRRRDTYRLNT